MRPAVMPCTACEDPAPRKAPAPPPTVAKSPSAFLLEWCSWRSPVPSSALLVLEAFARDASDLLAPARSSLAASGALGRPVARRAPTIPRPVPFRCALQPGYALLTWSRLAQSANPILNSRRSPHRSSSEERWQGAGRTRRSCLFLGGEKRRAQTQPGGSIVRQGEDRSRAWCALEINEHEKKTNGVVFVSPPTTSSSQLPCMRRGPRFRFRPRSGRLAAAIT